MPGDRELDFHPGMGMRWEIRRSTEETGGELFESMHWYDPREPGPIVHVHPDHDDTFAVIDGTLEVCIDGEWRSVGAGETATAPAGVPHTFSQRQRPDREGEDHHAELMSGEEKTFQGQCFCGAVTITVTGDPEAAGYCHCVACRSWSAGPVNAFTLWKPEALKVTQGEDQIGEYHANERSYRQWCKVCGGHLLTRHPEWGLVDVYAATIPELPFAPEVHVNYESTVLRMTDGLPKLKDFPEELGGSGETIAE